MTEDEREPEAAAMNSLMIRLQREAADWTRPVRNAPLVPLVIEKYRNPGEPYQVCVRQQGSVIHGYWRREMGSYFFSQDPGGTPVIGVDTEDEVVLHTRAYCTRRSGLKGTSSGPQVHSKPKGFSIKMSDVETDEIVRVFVTAQALHGELDGNAGPKDQFHGKRVLEQHRRRIEQAASRKYVEKGVVEELDGKPALWVRAMDL